MITWLNIYESTFTFWTKSWPGCCKCMRSRFRIHRRIPCGSCKGRFAGRRCPYWGGCLSWWSGFAACRRRRMSWRRRRLSCLRRSGCPGARWRMHRTNTWCRFLANSTKLWWAPRMLAGLSWSCQASQYQSLKAHNLQRRRWISAGLSQPWKGTYFCWALAFLSSNCSRWSRLHMSWRYCRGASQLRKCMSCRRPPSSGLPLGWSYSEARSMCHSWTRKHDCLTARCSWLLQLWRFCHHWFGWNRILLECWSQCSKPLFACVHGPRCRTSRFSNRIWRNGFCWCIPRRLRCFSIGFEICSAFWFQFARSCWPWRVTSCGWSKCCTGSLRLTCVVYCVNSLGWCCFGGHGCRYWFGQLYLCLYESLKNWLPLVLDCVSQCFQTHSNLKHLMSQQIVDYLVDSCH